MSSVQLLVGYPCQALAKASICALYLRIFESRRWIRYTAWVIIVGFVLVDLVGFILALVSGIEQHWTNGEDGGVNMSVYQVIQCVYSIITDLVLLGIPIRPIITMNLSRRKRIGLVAVFLAGIGGTATTVVMLYWQIEYYWYVETLSVKLRDWTWTVSTVDVFA